MKKKVLAMLLAAVLAVSLLPGTAFAEGNGFHITDRGELYLYDGPGGDVTIQPGITAIGDGAFFNCENVTSITIPGSVTKIGENAFAGCTNLTSITIPDRVTTIGRSAFNSCESLTSVVIPEGVTRIGDNAFWNCQSLTDVVIPSSVTSIGAWAFNQCTSLTGVVVLSNVTSIGDYAFRWCKSLTGVVISGDITSIGEGVFYECTSLTDAVIPDSVTSIGDHAFYYTNLTDVVIPDGVTSIGEGAFRNCANLTSVVIPDSVTGLGDYTFYGTGLTSVDIPEGVTTIGKSVFAFCKSLTSVTIPASVTSIGGNVFSGCGNLTGINVASGNPAYASVDGVLFDADQTLLLAYPAGRNDLSYSIPDGVTAIGEGVFRLCALTGVTIPASVTTIGVDAFRACPKLTDVYYGGTEDQWADISIGNFNDPLTGANIHYNSTGPDTTKPAEPTDPKPETPAITFNDVPADSWYASAVSFAVERGLLEGDGKGNFNPNDKLTRAQTFAILARLDGKTVTGGNWIDTATQWAVGKDVSTGENPGSDVTREQLVVMLWRYADEPGADTSVLSGYPDRTGLHDWGEPAMAWAVAAKIVEGDGGKLMPQGNADRAQAVTMIQRYCENLEELSGGGKG